MYGPWDSVTQLINAGIDMYMVPGDKGVTQVRTVINGFKAAIQNGTISN